MKKEIRSGVFRLAEARRAAKTKDGKRFVVRGHGVLFHDGKLEPFAAGDAVFIAAGVEHRFEDFSEDLAVWVAFYGPKGGEQRAGGAA